MLSGENSILKNSQNAKTETEFKSVEEKVKIAVAGAYSSNGTFNVETFKEELNRFGITYSEDGNDLLIETSNGKQIMVSQTTGEIREGVHKIAYNYNGGTDKGTVPTDDNEYQEGESVTIKFSPIPQRRGYEFLGWATTANATEPEYKSDGTTTVTMGKKTITLYAVWKFVGLSGQDLSIGEEVTCEGEDFFVIEASPASNGNVKLISKFNLNQTGTAQQNANTSTTSCIFSDSKYWSGNSENLNTNSAPAGSAYQKAKAYGAAKGGIGRLMTYDEANALKYANTKILYGKNIGVVDDYLNYWLGTSIPNDGSSGYVWHINGLSGTSAGGVGDFGYHIYNYNVDYGIRPVIEISKSKVT